MSKQVKDILTRELAARYGEATNAVWVEMIGVDGIVKPDGKTTVTVRVAFSAPVALGVKPTVQVVGVLPATRELPLNVTALGEVAALIVTEPGLTGFASWLVLTLNVLAG